MTSQNEVNGLCLKELSVSADLKKWFPGFLDFFAVPLVKPLTTFRLSVY